jgi:hypothetical protein
MIGTTFSCESSVQPRLMHCSPLSNHHVSPVPIDIGQLTLSMENRSLCASFRTVVTPRTSRPLSTSPRNGTESPAPCPRGARRTYGEISESLIRRRSRRGTTGRHGVRERRRRPDRILRLHRGSSGSRDRVRGDRLTFTRRNDSSWTCRGGRLHAKESSRSTLRECSYCRYTCEIEPLPSNPLDSSVLSALWKPMLTPSTPQTLLVFVNILQPVIPLPLPVRH